MKSELGRIVSRHFGAFHEIPIDANRPRKKPCVTKWLYPTIGQIMELSDCNHITADKTSKFQPRWVRPTGFFRF